MPDSTTNERLLSIFREKGLRATPQRIGVYRFLKEHPIHPSADTVYREMVKTQPGFSRTTIYNTLNALVENGLAIVVKLDEKELRYDGNPKYHGHFRCSKCGKIIDFSPDYVDFEGLSGCQILQQDVYFTGYCTECNKCLSINQS